jgi:predicted nucleic-acid-binding protein
MKKALYFFIFFVVSCTNKQTTKVADNKTNEINKIKVDSTSTTNSDSLKDNSNYYYMSNIPTKDFAELLSKDSIMVNDYKGIHNCLDSLSSNNKDTRDYYFAVLNKVLDNLEVVLHQQMGIHLVKNIDKFKGEFLDRLSNMNKEQIKFYAQGIECYLSERKDKGEKWLESIKLLKNNANSEQMTKLKLFLKEIELAKNDTME